MRNCRLGMSVETSSVSVVQVELMAVELPVHVGVGEKDLRWATFDNYVENGRAAQLIERLRGKDHGGVCFAPRLKSLDHIFLNARRLQENPRLINEESLERRADLTVRDDGIRAVQNVKEQRFQKLGILAHSLEVETLESGKRNGVHRVVKEETELARLRPLRESRRKAVPKRISQNAQSSEERVNGVEVFDLLVKVSLFEWIQFERNRALQQNLDEQV